MAARARGQPCPPAAAALAMPCLATSTN
jgi:hypothetical protein